MLVEKSTDKVCFKLEKFIQYIVISLGTIFIICLKRYIK